VALLIVACNRIKVFEKMDGILSVCGKDIFEFFHRHFGFCAEEFFKYSMKNVNKKSRIWRGVVGIEPTIASCPEHSLVLQTRRGPAPLPLKIIIP